MKETRKKHILVEKKPTPYLELKWELFDPRKFNLLCKAALDEMNSYPVL